MTCDSFAEAKLFTTHLGDFVSRLIFPLIFSSLAVLAVVPSYAETVNCQWCDGSPTICGSVSKEINLNGSFDERTLKWDNGARKFEANYYVKPDSSGAMRISQIALSAWIQTTDQFNSASALGNPDSIIMTFGTLRASLGHSVLCKLLPAGSTPPPDKNLPTSL
jgi:hypothetical protein